MKIVELAEPCLAAWEQAHAQGFDDSFDWEFVPHWFAACVDDDLEVSLKDPVMAASATLQHISEN